jgi:LacI family transcriptional regulator
MRAGMGSSRTRPRARATIHEVARAAGVSIKTVSRVLNREPNVRPETSDRVTRAAAKLRYTPNIAARRLASHGSFLIGLLFEPSNHPSTYIAEVQRGAMRQGYDLLLHPCQTSDENWMDHVDRLIRQSAVDGLILTSPISDSAPMLRALRENGTPFVRISQAKPGGHPPCVRVNDEEAAAAMTRHLLDFGHRRIGFVIGRATHGSSVDRLRGFKRALADARLPVNEDLLEQGDYTFESGYRAARHLLTHPQRPTAIFASNDEMAAGVLLAAHERGIDIPGELSVCGFDGAPLSEQVWPQLTTVAQPVLDVAALATDLLVRRLRDEDVPAISELRAEQVVRRSTGPAPA